MKSELDILNEIKLKKELKRKKRYEKKVKKNKKINEKIHKKNIKIAFKLFKRGYIMGNDVFHFYEGFHQYRYVKNEIDYYGNLIELFNEKYPELRFSFTLFGNGIVWKEKDKK